MELQSGPARPAADAVDSRAAPAPAPATAFKKPLPSVNFGGSPGAGRAGRTATSDMDRPSTSLDRLPIQVSFTSVQYRELLCFSDSNKSNYKTVLSFSALCGVLC